MKTSSINVRIVSPPPSSAHQSSSVSSPRSPKPMQPMPVQDTSAVCSVITKSSSKSSSSFDDFEQETLSKWNVEEEPHSMGMMSLPKYTQLEAHRAPAPPKQMTPIPNEPTVALEKDIEKMDLTPSRPVKIRRVRYYNHIAD